MQMLNMALRVLFVILVLFLPENSSVAKKETKIVTGKWVAGDWSDCLTILEYTSIPTSSDPLLIYKSIRTRRVSCVLSNGSISSSGCLSFLQPLIRKPCCSETWTPWSSCDNEYLGKQRRVRYSRSPLSPSSCQEDIQLRVCNGREEHTLPRPLPLAVSEVEEFPRSISKSLSPRLYAGPWSPCERIEKEGKPEHIVVPSPASSKFYSRNRRSNFSPTFPPRVNPRRHSPGRPELWRPKLPSDLEVSLIESKLSPPRLGFQGRTVSCRGEKGETLPLRVCVDGSSDMMVPTEVKSCIIPVNCKVTEWSSWNLDEDCRRSRKVRTRTITIPPQGRRGEACPHLEEFKEVHGNEGPAEDLSECRESYMLVSSSWSDCLTLNHRGEPALCGGGLQTRNISCLRRETQQPVDTSLCSHLIQIPRIQRCSTKCEEKCRVALWGQWSLCIPIDCHMDGNHTVRGYQTRRRRVSSGPDSLTSCPHLEETRSCSLSSCYKWEIIPGKKGEVNSKCFPSERGASCGRGKKKYSYQCLDYNGEPVENDLCRKQKIDLSQESCYIPCPDDCVWSEWSPWSPCPQTCSGSKDRLPISQRNRTLVAKGRPESPSCSSQQLSEIRICPSSQCEVYSWRTEPWGLCRSTNSSSGCGEGGRGREVVCSNENEIRAPDWRCRHLQSPISWQSCLIPCPVDCQLTAWALWSPCRKKCETGGQRGGNLPSPSTVIMDTQSRSRSVLQWPSSGGKACPSRMEIRPCPLLASSCSSLRWSPEPWSNCTLPVGKMCGDGVRSRGLICLKAGVEVHTKECFKANGLSLPVQAEPCSVLCSNMRSSRNKKRKNSKACVLATWSPWSDCSVGCPSTRQRQRKRNMEKGLYDPCNNSTTGPSSVSQETESCPCMNYTSRAVGPWSECILEEPEEDSSFSSNQVSKRGSNKICGVGRRFQRLECYDENSFMSDIKYCGGKSFIEKSCIVVCPMDCHMSPWSDWGLCDSNCGPGLKNRTSKVLRLPTEGGRPCPGPTVEYSTCNYPCENFRWHSGPWSECLLSGGKSCGEGVRQRSVRCVQDPEEKGSSISVPDEFCDLEEKPSERETCNLFCSGECAYSEWSSWSGCSQGGNGGSNRSRKKRNKRPSKFCGRQKRIREILREGSSPCPKTTRESRPCPHCRSSYSWALTPWSSCRPFGDSGCGEGRQYRGIRCVRNEDGRSVKEELCNRPQRELELSTWCSVDCPVDCEVSDWSTWSKESCLCGPGTKNSSRSRVVTTPGTPSGRPCPSKLQETKPCPGIPCYDWHRTPWTCDIQGATCGVGVARRNVSCVRSSYSAFSNSHIRYASRIPSEFKVSSEFCLRGKGAKKSSERALLESNMNRRVLDLHEEDVCSKSCPGDCKISEWSSWSQCVSPCIGVPTLGIRRRTRYILEPPKMPHGQCTTFLEDEQPCSSEACYSFTWKTMKNGRQECVRSDGKIVRDGCHKGDCDPPCNAPHSECGPGLICRCFPGYRPQYLPPPILSSRAPKLIACIKMSTTEGGNASGAYSSSSSSQVLASEEDMLSDGRENEVIDFKYFPDDSQLNYWMFAMIAIGCVFVAFVGVSIYIMCKSSNRQRQPRATK